MKQWAIIVGLNDYQFFQPLSCAQRDAQALHQFLVDEAGFPAEQCLLLTDTSVPLWGKSTKPTRSNLLEWVELLAQNCLKPDDSLWFFFSGYGVCSQGRDYLVPLDGDPFAVETTCVLMSSIFSRLQAAISPGMLLFLFDMNRSQGMFSNESVGRQTAQLAKQFAVPTIISCNPNQFSREISSLGHSLFTVTLLEGLRYYQGATPATLMQFLGNRLPELSEYYYLPSQQPMSVCPSDRLHQTLLPGHYMTQTLPDMEREGNGRATVSTAQQLGGFVEQELMVAKAIDKRFVQEQQQNSSYQEQSPANSLSGNGTLRNGVTSDRYPEESITENHRVSINHVANGASPMFSHTQSTKTLGEPLRDRVPATTLSSSTAPSNGDHVMNSGSVPNAASSDGSFPKDLNHDRLPRRVFWLCGLLSLSLIVGVLWRNWSAIWADPQPAMANSPSVVASASSVPNQTSEQIRPTSANVDTPSDVSPSESVETQPSAQALNFSPTLRPNPSGAQATGQEILATARRMVWSDQATPYRDAIAEAKKISPDDPAYPVAQQDIAVWSQIILNIAQQRANQKQWDIAIMAADLVPPENQALRTQAQVALTEWCPMVKNQPAQFFPMQQAKNICSQQPI